MKALKIGLRMFIVVAGFLCVAVYGQDSLETDKPEGATPEQSEMSTTSEESISDVAVNSEETADTEESDSSDEETADTEETVSSDEETTDTEETVSSDEETTDTEETVSSDEETADTEETVSSDESEDDEETAAEESVESTESETETEVAEDAAEDEEKVVASSESEEEEETGDEKVIELEKDVVVGYGTMKKEDLTGSVTAVKTEDLAREAAYSVRKALQGKAAGVTVTANSGQPGKAVTVRIRGVGTINQSDPLYVVDGTPVNSIDYLNPNDIESMAILKDASATAIYGSRGANGVIMVTTKKGKEGSRIINYDMSFGMNEPWKEPDMTNAKEWGELRDEAIRRGNEVVKMKPDWEPSDTTEIKPYPDVGEGTYWFKEVTREHAYTNRQNVSVAQGNDKLKYFLSAGLLNQEGIIKKTELDKIMLRFNAEQKLADWFTLGNNIGIGRSDIVYTNEQDEHNHTLIMALSMDPVTKPRKADGSYAGSEYNNARNPIGRSEYFDINAKNTVFTGSIYSTIDLMKNLKFKTSFSMDMQFKDSTQFIHKYNISGNDNQANADVLRRTGTDNTWIFENTLTYDTYFLDDHTLKLLMGTTAQNREWDSVFARNVITPDNEPSSRYLNATQGTTPQVNGVAGGNSLASFFGRAEYDYANRYLLTATYRADGSSRFAEANRWGYFPSVAGAWKVSNENFMSGVTFIEGLKFRVGWGKTGNQEIGDYLFLTTETGNQNYVLDDQVVVGTTALSKGNNQIHWEEQVATNAGFDMNIIGGRVELSVDYFIKRTNDMLVSPPIPTMSGLRNPPIVNGGEVQNTGFELVVNYREAIGDFTSNVSLNISRYVNEVLSLGGDNAPIMDCIVRNSGQVTRTEVGHPIGSFYGLVTDGLFQTDAEAENYVYSDGTRIQPGTFAGDIKFVYDAEKKALKKDFIGSPHPDFTAGFNVDLTYKGIDFNLGLFGSYGNEIFNGVRWYTDNTSAFYGLDSRMLGRWTPSNPHNDVNMPRMSTKDANNIQMSDRYVEDGSYLRVKTLQLGYSFDNTLLNKINVKKCRIYVGAENLLTFTKYSGMDPEVGLGPRDGFTTNGALSMGVDKITYPQARTYMVGLNLTL